jgi:hypothetical protein
MKNITPFLAILFLLNACNNSADNYDKEKTTTDTLAFGENPTDTLVFWNVDEQHNTRTKVLTEKIEQPNAQAIINGLNMVYPDVVLLYVNIANDTLHLAIPQSDKLTRQMGSAGAAQYFATACVNLFEISSINYIHFDFKEGDHARPGVFSRQQFDDIKEVK